jgi:ABC-type Fe3+/spermidine/putrescine transport system ATPase subunit
LLVWIIYRSQLRGRGAIEYLVMFPQAVPRLVFGLALLWAWLNIPIGIYGTLWLLALAYFTVMLPLGVRTLAGVVLQIDKSLEECARVCGASWGYQMRTVTLPLLKPGILAAWLPDLHGLRARTGRLGLPDGPQCQGDRTVDRQRLRYQRHRADGGDGADPDLHGDRGVDHPVPRGARHDQGAAVSVTRIEVKDLVVRYGDQVAVNGVSFTVGRGDHLTLLGPSGCGKTTTLRAIAGLEQPSGGSIRIDGQTMYDGAEGKNVQTEQRGVSMVFQSYAIWPHMSVFDNVAYGLRVRKTEQCRHPDQRRARARPGADAPPRRSAAPPSFRAASSSAWRSPAPSPFRPTVVLFDEPLSNLDAKLRAEMRVETARAAAAASASPSVYVTHDQEEALAISDRVIVMNVGVIEQIGTPEEIYNRPRSRFVADFVGSANLIKGKWTGEDLFMAEGRRHPEGGLLAQAARPRDRSGRTHRLHRVRAAARRQPGPGHGAPAPVPWRLRAIRHRQRRRPAERPPAADQSLGGGRSGDGILLARALRAAGRLERLSACTASICSRYCDFRFSRFCAMDSGSIARGLSSRLPLPSLTPLRPSVPSRASGGGER